MLSIANPIIQQSNLIDCLDLSKELSIELDRLEAETEFRDKHWVLKIPSSSTERMWDTYKIPVNQGFKATLAYIKLINNFDVKSFKE